MEVTSIFKRIVHEVETRPSPDSSDPGPDKTRILKSSKSNKKDQFEAKAVLIVDNISRLRSFLASNRDAYVDVNINRDHSISGLTDLERDKIDAGASNIIRTINQLISNFKKDLKEAKHLKAQRVQHLEAVTDILEDELKSACKIYSEQKAIRVEKELLFQKLSRLEVPKRPSKRDLSPASQGPDSLSLADDEDVFESEIKQRRESKVATKKVQLEEREEPKSPNFQEWSDDDDDDIGLSPEEEQMLARENDRMYEDLVSLRDTVQQIETKVVRIAELQEIFTEKVLQQKDDIDLISRNTIGTTENIRDGNEELRKAIQRNASIRIYILFFLLVMSFSLLFLDWYND